MIKAVIIGFSHMHCNEVALYISENPDFRLVGIADIKSDLEDIHAYTYTPVWNLENVKNNYCGNCYDDYKKMLDETKPDIAFILCENAQKPIVVEECAKRGVNVCIEKPIAVSMEEAEKIRASVEKYGVEAIVNWPVAWRGYVHKMKAAVDSGIVGKPLKLRYINGHTGPLGKGAKHRGVSHNVEEISDDERAKTWWHKLSHGGGVFLDIACYGCFFSRWFFGNDAERIMAYGANLNTPFGDTEDNFAAIIRYDGRMSVIEGTWTTPRAVIPSGPMLICSDGVVMCTGGAENAPDVEAYDTFGNKIEIPDTVLGDEYKNMTWQYANHVKNGAPMHEMLTLEANLDVMKLLDGAIKSSAGGKEESLK